MSTLQSLDSKYHATDKAKSVDQSYGVTQRTNSLLSGLTSYYEKAAGTPTGQKLVNFYTQTSRQVQDIHAEARRLADIKKQEAGGSEKSKWDDPMLENAANNQLLASTPTDAHSVATEGTSVVDSAKVAPLEPEKTT